MKPEDRLRTLPKVDAVLLDPGLDASLQRWPRPVVLRVVQQEIDGVRAQLRRDGGALSNDREALQGQIVQRARERLVALGQTTLRPVINAPGVVLHTNLGRAPLSEAAIAAVAAAARGYVNLEYEIDPDNSTADCRVQILRKPCITMPLLSGPRLARRGKRDTMVACSQRSSTRPAGERTP